MKKIIMFEGDIETQGYFSLQMKKTFEEDGYEVLMYDFDKEGKSLSKLLRFAERGNTVMISFNFHGLTTDEYVRDENGRWFWDDMGIPCINIVVDHPYYYYKFLKIAPRGYIHISIDRSHDAYMKRFFPEIRRGPFLPLGGTKLPDQIPLPERSMDICFTGNYTPPANFHSYIERFGKEYAAFYYGIIDDLIAHPWETIEAVSERHIRQEIPEVTEEELKETFPNFIFIDVYVRFYMRGKVVQTLLDAGYKVHVFGDGWSKLKCEHPENMINGHPQDSYGCLRNIADSRISLNVMPWFKDGAHDRIFNSMLNGAVCVTDSSIYLDEILKDNENCIRYDLQKIEDLPDRIGDLLAHPERMQQIADAGQQMAEEGHTWADRARKLEKLIAEMEETK